LLHFVIGKKYEILSFPKNLVETIQQISKKKSFPNLHPGEYFQDFFWQTKFRRKTSKKCRKKAMMTTLKCPTRKTKLKCQSYIFFCVTDALGKWDSFLADSNV